MPPLLDAFAGLLLVSAALTDVFRSVVLPRATQRTLRIGPMVGTLMLRAWQGWARKRPRRRHALLGILGPLLLVLEMLIWIGLLVLGYALLLHASGGLRPESYGDALYAGASAFFTTGLSGQEAHGLARLVIALAGLSGLAVVTLVVTFLLSVHGALLRREALVLRLRARTGPHPSGAAILKLHGRLSYEDDGALRGFFSEWEEWAADVLLTHRAFPILVYFRSTDEDCGWLAALGAVLDAAALVIVMPHTRASEHAAACQQIGARLAADLARLFALRAPAEPGLTEAAFTKAVGRLRAAGYRFTQAEAETWTQFQALRTTYLPPLQAVTAHFGEAGPRW